MRYFFDIMERIKDLVPSVLRSTGYLTLVQTALSPLEDYANSWNEFATSQRREAAFNCQQMYLEKALNIKFDPNLERIYIEDGLLNEFPPFLYNKVEQRTPRYIYNKSENTPSKWYFWNRSEYNSGPSFIVRVPALLMGQEREIRAIIDRLRQAGVIYQVLPI